MRVVGNTAYRDQRSRLSRRRNSWCGWSPGLWAVEQARGEVLGDRQAAWTAPKLDLRGLL